MDFNMNMHRLADRMTRWHRGPSHWSDSYVPQDPGRALVAGLIAGSVIGALTTVLCTAGLKRARIAAERRRARREELASEERGERLSAAGLRVPSHLMPERSDPKGREAGSESH